MNSEIERTLSDIEIFSAYLSLGLKTTNSNQTIVLQYSNTEGNKNFKRNI